MKELAIMMRIKLQCEDLNNETVVGNIIQPREITLANGEVRQAISGEMLKHMHTKNLRTLADENELCSSCKIFSPMKNGKIEEKDEELSASGNRVKKCIIDDVEGFLNAAKGGNEKRESCIKFSWAIATEENEYETMLHTRVDNCTVVKKSGDEGNTQMLFHRPIRSNEYALNIYVDLGRIGFDDEKLKYTLDEESIKLRQQKCINAIVKMFTNVQGAMCSTRLPHTSDVKGIVTMGENNEDIVSIYSPLKDDYIEMNKKVSTNSKEFKDMNEFKEILMSLV